MTGLVAAFVVAGCSSDGPTTSAEPLPELAERAIPLDALDEETSADAGDGGDGGGGVPSTTRPTTTLAGSPPPEVDDGGLPAGGPPPPPSFTRFFALPDAADDAGLTTPSRADLAAVEMADDGTSLRVTVSMHGEVPAVLDDGEVMGVGVDLFRSEGESDHQLFADGGTDGWRAFLQTPDGFVDYPGRFAVGGRSIVFQLPWSSVGGRAPFEVRAFVDWSRPQVVVAESGGDRAPERGRAPATP